jgi:hypothetical protein
MFMRMSMLFYCALNTNDDTDTFTDNDKNTQRAHDMHYSCLRPLNEVLFSFLALFLVLLLSQICHDI